MNSKINTNWSLIEEEGKSRRIEKKVGNSLFKNKKSNKFTHLLKRSILRMVHMETKVPGSSPTIPISLTFH
jgi:hypothetical protein